jgi:sRNA-binding protein
MFCGRGVVVTLATLGIAHCQGTGRWTLDTGRNEHAMHARITLSQTDTRQQRRRNDDIDEVAKAAAAGGAAAPETAAAASVATTVSVATVWIA